MPSPLPSGKPAQHAASANCAVLPPAGARLDPPGPADNSDPVALGRVSIAAGLPAAGPLALGHPEAVAMSFARRTQWPLPLPIAPKPAQIFALVPDPEANCLYRLVLGRRAPSK